jgi:hypothetical protein
MSTKLSQIEELVHRSQFVFRGVVQRLNTTTVPGIPVNARTAVVRIEEVLHAPGVLSGHAGQEITVQLSRPAKTGERGIFFTLPRVYAKSVAVDEVERLQAGSDQRTLREGATQVKDAVAKIPDRHVQRRSSDADLVVVGKVASITSLRARQQYARTRHDPDWQEASIAVQAVEKGSLRGKSVVVLFPQSRDVMWYPSPKFSVGQEGVWILHRQPIKGLNAQYYLALDPGDFHPKDQQSRIRKLLKATG